MNIPGEKTKPGVFSKNEYRESKKPS